MSEKVRNALDYVRLSGFEDRYPQQLSGGQQQRVAFARAIVSEPECILFDEPLSALDAVLRDEMRCEIKKLTAETGVTAVFVTHDQAEAMSLSDQIYVLNKGRIVQHARPEEIYNYPACKFVAEFIGKSNWVDEVTMFRPEKAKLRNGADCRMFDAKIVNQQFLGGYYEIYLEFEGRRWLIESPVRYGGEFMPVYVEKSDLHFVGK